MAKKMTLCFVRDGQSILLGMKKRGFGVGKWNGYGGKLKPGETIESAAARELYEESSLNGKDFDRRGILEFVYGSDEVHEVHIFNIIDYEGEPVETEEMKPEWFTLDRVPFADMWPDDPYWLPLFLAGEKFTGRFVFNEAKEIVSYEVQRVNNFRNIVREV